MKKIFVFGLTVLILLLAFIGCDDGNNGNGDVIDPFDGKVIGIEYRYEYQSHFPSYISSSDGGYRDGWLVFSQDKVEQLWTGGSGIIFDSDMVITPSKETLHPNGISIRNTARGYTEGNKLFLENNKNKPVEVGFFENNKLIIIVNTYSFPDNNSDLYSFIEYHKTN